MEAREEQADTDGTVLVLVDGTCVFCSRLVQFILRFDRKKVFRFAHLQGQLAFNVLKRHGLRLNVDYIYAITDFGTEAEKVHIDGQAGKIIWPTLFPVLFFIRWIPVPLLNLIYVFFAKCRYKLFGKYESCRLPTGEERERFFD